MTNEAFTVGMTLLREIFPRDLSEAAAGVYAEACAELSDDVWLAAVRRVCHTATFFPKPAELLAAAHAVTADAYRVLSPDVAWEHVHDVSRGWHEGQSVRDRFDDVTWDALRAIGGIRVVAMAEDGYEISEKRKLFLSAYAPRANRRIENVASLRMPDATAPSLMDGRR